MNYQLKKNGIGSWKLSQGNNGTNEINQKFKSATSALNFVSQKKNTVLFFREHIVVDADLAKRLDRVKFMDTIRNNYPEVDTVKFSGQTTRVTLYDGRFGTTICHENDTYSKQAGFLFAYNKARVKTITIDNIKAMERHQMKLQKQICDTQMKEMFGTTESKFEDIIEFISKL